MPEDLFWRLFGGMGAVGLVAVFALSFFHKRWPLGLGERGGLSRRSSWIRRRTTRFMLRLVRTTSLPLAVVALFLGWWAIALLYGYMGATYLLVRRHQRTVGREWDLWQQLGYDGPPDLEQQALSLTPPPTPERI